MDEEERIRYENENNGAYGQTFALQALLDELDAAPLEEDDESNLQTPPRTTSRVPPHSAARSASRTSPGEDTPVIRPPMPLILDSPPTIQRSATGRYASRTSRTLPMTPSIEATQPVTPSIEATQPRRMSPTPSPTPSPAFRGGQTPPSRRRKRPRLQMIIAEDKSNNELFPATSYADFRDQFGSNVNLQACIVARTHLDRGFDLCVSINNSAARVLLKVEFEEAGKERLARELRMINYIDRRNVDVERHDIARACEMHFSVANAMTEIQRYVDHVGAECVHFPLANLFAVAREARTAYVVQCIYRKVVPLYRILTHANYVEPPMRYLAELFMVLKVLDSMEKMRAQDVVNLNIDAHKVFVLLSPGGLRVLIDVQTAGLGGYASRKQEFMGIDSFALGSVVFEGATAGNTIQKEISLDNRFFRALETYDMYLFTKKLLLPALKKIYDAQEAANLSEMPFDDVYEMASSAVVDYERFVFEHGYDEAAHHKRRDFFDDLIYNLTQISARANATNVFIEKFALGALGDNFGERC
jgi:hypothetical protein